MLRMWNAVEKQKNFQMMSIFHINFCIDSNHDKVLLAQSSCYCCQLDVSTDADAPATSSN